MSTSPTEIQPTSGVPSLSIVASTALQRGNALLMQRKIDEAIAAYSQAIALNPQDAKAYNNRGVAHVNTRRFNQAVEDFNTAIRLHPNYAAAYLNRGAAYGRKGKRDAALKEYHAAIQRAPGLAEVYLNLAMLYEAEGAHQLAMANYDKPIQLRPDDADGYYFRGLAYHGRGKTDEALADYSSAIRCNPCHANAYYRRSQQHYYAKGDAKKALEDAQKVLQFAPNYVTEYSHQWLIYREKDDDVYAFQGYPVALGSNPAIAEVYTERGSLALSHGETNRALNDFHTAIKLDADAGVAYGNAGVAYCDFGDWKKVKADWIVATLLRVDVLALFHNRYKSVADFEQKTGLQMPAHIAAMLKPQEILNLIAASGIPYGQLGALRLLNRSDNAFRELQRKIRLKLALKAYDNRELSTGLSARLAGIPTAEFIYVMRDYGLSPIRLTVEELAKDVANAHKASHCE